MKTINETLPVNHPQPDIHALGRRFDIFCHIYNDDPDNARRIQDAYTRQTDDLNERNLNTFNTWCDVYGIDV